MTASAILMVIIVVLAAAIRQTANVFSRSQASVSTFQAARNSFETLTQNLRLATLNVYWDYDDDENPERYLRQSDLGFFAGPARTALGDNNYGPGDCLFFYTPGRQTKVADLRGLDGMLVIQGFYVEYGPEAARPSFAPEADTYRFRLMQSVVPAESTQLARDSTGWREITLHGSHSYPLAENVLLLSVRLLRRDENGDDVFLGSDALKSEYDSTQDAMADPQPETAHQLPPIVELTMVAVDETSYARMYGNGTATPPVIVPSTAFQNPGQYEDDLEGLKTRLQDLGLDYRIFTTRVGLRAARWSQEASSTSP